MKKLISFLMVFIMTVSMTNGIITFASDDEYYTASYSIKRGFEEQKKGDQPPESITNGNVFRVEEFPSATNKSVYFEGTGQYAAFMTGSVDEIGVIVASFDIMYKKLGTSGLVQFEAKNMAGGSKIVIYLDTNGDLRAADGTLLAIGGVKDEFANVAVVLDIPNCLMDVYYNDVLVAKRVASGTDGFSDIHEMRLNVGGSQAQIYIDNYKVYVADMPDTYAKKIGKKIMDSSGASFATSEKASEYMGNSISFFDNKNKYYYKGKTEVWNGTSPLYKVEDGKGYISTDFASSVLSAELEGDGGYADITLLSEKLGKKLTLDKNGLAVVADRDNYFDFISDLSVYRYVTRELAFETVPASEMKSMLDARYGANEHPRLMKNKDGFEKLKADARNDEQLKAAVDSKIKDADALLKNGTIVKYEFDTENVNLPTARSFDTIATTLGFAYQYTGNTKYAELLWKNIEAICGYENGWCNKHMLTTAHYLFGSAIAYDWIYDFLTEEQRTFFRNFIIENGLKPAIEDYEDVPGRSRTFKWVQASTTSNWKTVVNTAVVAAATAIVDEEGEIALKCLDYAMENIKQSLMGYSPDGGWDEGTTYWLYATGYMANFFACIESAYGSDFGYFDAPGISSAIDYIVTIQGQNGTFNYGDSNNTRIVSNAFLLFSRKLNRPDIQKYTLDNGAGIDVYNYVAEYNSYEGEMELPLDYYSRGIETVTMRNNYDKNSIFVGLHSGAVSGPHSQIDSGSFVIDAYGTNFAFDFDSPNYSLRPYNYVYRRRAEGHNLYVINPSFEPGQNTKAVPIINKFETSETSAFAITDLTSAYTPQAVSAKRGLMMTDNRESIILQDEISLAKPSDFWWFIHSKADITVSEDGKTAIFHGKYKDMKAELLTDCGGVFSVMKAEPLPTSYKISNDHNDSKYKKLTLHILEAKDMTIAVAFTFQWPGADSSSSYKVIPLDDWKVDEGTIAKKPKLDDIKVNGKTIADFSSDNTLYTYYYDDVEDVPEITASGKGEIDITYPEGKSGMVLIAVTDTDTGVKETYAVKLAAQHLELLSTGEKQIFIKSVSADSIPEQQNGPENAIDGDLDTRYVGTGTPNITFDFGEEVNVSKIGVAVYQGGVNDGRKQSFEVFASTDGENFTSIGKGTTTGTTLEKEFYKLKSTNARYVRLQGTAINGKPGGYNSFTEITVYGKKGVN